MEKSCVIFWFRRDLRWRDNVGLYNALSSGAPVLPLFIFDTDILDSLPPEDRRVRFIWETLMKMDQRLFEEHGTRMKILYGRPTDCMASLLEPYRVKAVYANRDYEPYAIARDNQIAELLDQYGIAFHTFKDQVIFEQDEVTKDDGKPYVVYTPYRKKWEQAFQTTTDLIAYEVQQSDQRYVERTERTELSLQEMGFNAPQSSWPAYAMDNERIRRYEERRNFPAQPGTSRLGIYLRFGTLSIREVIRNIIGVENRTFLHELIWREFFMQILWHFPHTVHSSFKKEYDHIAWRNDESEFERWKTGNTGYPLIDAGMRELNATGYMHNRVRMLVSSFLCKHLLIDWRWGEAYFAEKLLDYEQASNVGNWQWAAGSGVDAAPYFRIFNPGTQIQKFDSQHEYIRTWVPEYQELTYPAPMVDHRAARERCLKVYKESLSQAAS